MLNPALNLLHWKDRQNKLLFGTQPTHHMKSLTHATSLRCISACQVTKYIAIQVALYEAPSWMVNRLSDYRSLTVTPDSNCLTFLMGNLDTQSMHGGPSRVVSQHVDCLIEPSVILVSIDGPVFVAYCGHGSKFS